MTVERYAPPPFSTMYIEVLNEVAEDRIDTLKLIVRTEDGQAPTLVINRLIRSPFCLIYYRV